jgi:hypothetical protein
MILLEAASAWRGPEGYLAQSLRKQSPRKHAALAATMLSLVTAFILAGAPATSAAPVANTVHVTSISDPPPPCVGEKPGMCPD